MIVSGPGQRCELLMALLKTPSILVFFLSPCYLSVGSGWIARLHHEINPFI